MKRLRRLILACLAVVLHAGGSLSAFGQGSLTPPGAPAPTMKRLDEIEPRTNLQATPAPAGVDTSNANYHFIINQPGSYYLSANIAVTKPHGIQINAEGVTLDLNGFQIARGSGSGGYGIEIPTASFRTTVRNGTIKGFDHAIFGTAHACAFRDLAVTGCTNYGIRTGDGAVLESCRASQNSGTAGIAAGWGSTLTNCAVMGNTVTFGITTGSSSALTNCTAYSNTAGFGINVSAGSSLTNCAASFNTGTGPVSGGISASNGCTFTGCATYFNDSTATQTFTTGMGIYVNSGCTIQKCTAGFNSGDGIRVASECLVRENDCSSNNSGIHSAGNNNRIEGNNVTSNGRGIIVDLAGNLIIRNSASDNTIDYSIAASNRYGPIVDISAAGAPAVSGKSAADTTGTSHPWANFSY
jgi:parallel beta-helix repeat protein